IAEPGVARAFDETHEASAGDVVVKRGPDKIGEPGQVREIFLGALERAERHIVPDMPADLQGGVDGFDGAINRRLKFVAAAGPEIFPREQFRIIQEQPPECREITVARTLAIATVAHESFHLTETAAGALDINAAVAPFFLTELAEAGGATGVLSAALGKAQRVEQSALTFRSPHDAADVVGARVIFDQSQREILVAGIVETWPARMTGSAPAMMVNFVKRFPIFHSGGKRVVLQQKTEHADAVLAGHRSEEHTS